MSHSLRSISVMPSAFAGGIVRSGLVPGEPVCRLGCGGVIRGSDVSIAFGSVVHDPIRMTSARDLGRTHERHEGSR